MLTGDQFRISSNEVSTETPVAHPVPARYLIGMRQTLQAIWVVAGLYAADEKEGGNTLG